MFRSLRGLTGWFGGFLKVDSGARRMTGGGRKENRGLSRAEPYTGVEGLSRSRSRDAS